MHKVITLIRLTDSVLVQMETSDRVQLSSLVPLAAELNSVNCDGVQLLLL